jgi:hypothetical protein
MAAAQGGFVDDWQGQARRQLLACDQPQSKSQVPRRRCSGTNSQIPTWLPEILSANS